MTVGPGLLVDSIPLAPPRISLLTSVDVVTDADAHFGSGITWWPEDCGPNMCVSDVYTGDYEDLSCVRPYWWQCEGTDQIEIGNGEGGGTEIEPTPPLHTKDPDNDQAANGEFRSFDIWVGIRCGNQNVYGELLARANRAMEAWQSHLIEHELWTGNVAALGGFPQWPGGVLGTKWHPTGDLMDMGVDTVGDSLGDDWGFVEAFGRLEDYLSTCQVGQTGVIHTSPKLASLWVHAGLIIPEPNGRRLRSALGTIVVPGSGYRQAQVEWVNLNNDQGAAVATGMPRVFLGPTSRLLDESGTAIGDRSSAEYDITVNTQTVRIERTVAVQLDGCCKGAIQTDNDQPYGNTD